MKLFNVFFTTVSGNNLTVWSVVGKSVFPEFVLNNTKRKK